MPDVALEFIASSYEFDPRYKDFMTPSETLWICGFRLACSTGSFARISRSTQKKSWKGGDKKELLY